VLTALVFGTLFLTSFWGPKAMVLSKREGLLPGPGLCLDKSWILAWSFGFLFCCCFGWRFRCSLGSCFDLCFCVVGGLGPGLVLAWSFQFLLVTILVVIFCI